MSQATTGASAGSRCRRSASATVLAACVASGLPLGSRAQEALQPVARVAAEVRAETPLRVELDASRLPQIDGPQAPGVPPARVGLTMLPARGSGVGMALGMTGLTPETTPGPVTPGLQSRQGVDLGVHWRLAPAGSRQIDVTAWRRLDTQDGAYLLAQQQQPVYGARVEMKLQPAGRSGLLADRGFIGMQLQSGARISIKRKNGKPMVYYRTTF